MKNNFIIELISDLDFEGMVVEISLANQVIVRLNYDKGIDAIEMEWISASTNGQNLFFPLDEFFDALAKAKNILLKCYKEDNPLEKS